MRRRGKFLSSHQVVGDISRQKSNACRLYCSLRTISHSAAVGAQSVGWKEMEWVHVTREMANGNKFYPIQSLDLITSSKVASGFENLLLELLLSITLLRAHCPEVKKLESFKEL